MSSNFERALKGELSEHVSPETLACITLATTDRPDPGTFDTDWRLLVDRLYKDIKRGALTPAHAETRDQFDSGIWAFIDRTSATGETTRYLLDQLGVTLYFKTLNDPLAKSLVSYDSTLHKF